MDQKNPFVPPPDAINLRGLMLDLWNARLAVGCVMVVCAVLGALAGWLPDKTYEASIVLSPASDSSTAGRLGGLASWAGQFGGLASLAGMSMPGQTKKEETLAVLQSELLTETYIRNNDLLPVLYSKLWD